MIWATSGEKLNPAIDTVLATTGGQNEGNVVFSILLSSNSNAHVKLQKLDNLNAVVGAQSLWIGANGIEIAGPFYISVSQGEKIRLVVGTALTGSIQASIIHGQ